MMEQPFLGICFEFEKYEATGNDFIIVNSEHLNRNLSSNEIALCCDRRFGIGADGFIILSKKATTTVEMQYFNSDGRLGSLCGNGTRAAFVYAQVHFEIDSEAQVQAFDGMHRLYQETKNSWIGLEMKPVSVVHETDEGYELNTGSPHFVLFLNDILEISVNETGRAIRNRPVYQKDGINVNFVAMNENGLRVRTYERGVEAETLSCGTGVTASALAFFKRNLKLGNQEVQIQTTGGALKVKAVQTPEGFEKIELWGPARRVFSGVITI